MRQVWHNIPSTPDGSEGSSQCLRRVREEPGTITMCPGRAVLLDKLFQRHRGFPRRTNISLRQWSNSSLLLWHRAFELSEAIGREWRHRAANKSPGVTAFWRNLWPVILEPKWIKIYGEKKINTAKDSFKDISGKGSQGAVFCLDMFPCHSCNFYFYFFGLFSSIHYFPFQRFVATEMHKLKAECCYITKFRR